MISFSIISFFNRFLDPPKPLRMRNRYITFAKIKSDGVNYSSEKRISEVTHVGVYVNGYINGPVWQFLQGGSFQFGIVEGVKDLTNITTANGAYINDDKKTGYKGSFVNGTLTKAQFVEIIGMEMEHQIVSPKFSDPKGDILTNVITTDGEFKDVTVTDLLEDKMVYVNNSQYHGQGLFAKTDIATNSIVAFFGGNLYTAHAWNKTTFFDPNYFAKFSDGRENYYVHLPDEYGNDLNKYRASLGHKVNHGWYSDIVNAFYVPNFHPRFGLIAAIKSNRDISAGEEIICHYNLEFHEAQAWYQESYRTDIEYDTPEGPYGHRESRKKSGQPIQPMLVDSEVYKSFLRYAEMELKLDALT